MGDDGVEGAFDFAHELTDKVATGVWVGDCFLFTNAANRLNYFVGGEVRPKALTRGGEAKGTRDGKRRPQARARGSTVLAYFLSNSLDRLVSTPFRRARFFFACGCFSCR